MLYALQKDRQLRRKEYADKVRHAASLVIAKLERWRELALRFSEDIQPLITDTDVKIIQEGDFVATRDFFWRGLVAARSVSSQRIVDEEIEMAYVDLYGYDPRIHDLFLSAVSQLKDLDEEYYAATLEMTQHAILKLAESKEPVHSAQLGNQLRGIYGLLARQSKVKMDSVIVPFRNEVIKLISVTDREIVSKLVKISTASKILPESRDAKGAKSVQPSLQDRYAAAILLEGGRANIFDWSTSGARSMLEERAVRSLHLSDPANIENDPPH